MAWLHGTLRDFGGFTTQDVVTYLPTITGTDFTSIVTTGGGVVSGGCALRLTKAAGGADGVRSLTIAATDAPAITLAFYIRTGITSGTSIIFNQFASNIPALGISNVGGNHKLIIAANEAPAVWWTGTATLSTSTQYYIQYMVRNPTPGVANTQWRGKVILRDSSGAELDRSPWVTVNQAGLGLSSVTSCSFGFPEIGSAQTAEAPDLIIDSYAIVTGGVFGPNVIYVNDNSSGAPIVPTGNGTDNAWIEGAGGRSDGDGNKWDEVDEIAVGTLADDDTSTCDSTSSTENNQTFTTSASNIALAGSEEVFAVCCFVKGKVVTGGGIIAPRLRHSGVISTASATISTSSYSWAKKFPAVNQGLTFVGGGGVEWDVASADACEIGFSRVLGSGTQDKRVTAVVKEILWGLPWDDTYDSGVTMRETDSLTSTRRPQNSIF